MNENNSVSKPDHIFKLIVVGPSNTGKTCFVNRFVNDTYSEKNESTIGLDLKYKILELDRKIVRLNIWDTAGQERYRSVVDLHYRGTHGCLGVFDITSHDSFEDLKEDIENIREFYDIDGDRIVIVGNKSDLDAERRVSMNEIIDFTIKIKSTYIEASAKTNYNVNEAFIGLARSIIDINEATQAALSPAKKRLSYKKIEIQRKKSTLEVTGRGPNQNPENQNKSTCC